MVWLTNVNSYLNVVTVKKPNVLIGFNQKVSQSGKQADLFCFHGHKRLPAERESLTHSVCCVELENPVWGTPNQWESKLQNLPMVLRVKEVRRSECRIVMVRILV
jgi:hypothetical protein